LPNDFFSANNLANLLVVAISISLVAPENH
jgi:hypothetical protein